MANWMGQQTVKANCPGIEHASASANLFKSIDSQRGESSLVDSAR